MKALEHGKVDGIAPCRDERPLMACFADYPPLVYPLEITLFENLELNFPQGGHDALKQAGSCPLKLSVDNGFGHPRSNVR